MRPECGLKQFRQDGSLSYILFDRESRAAAVIDPELELMQSYREYLLDHRLVLRFALDTQVHMDHFSATHLLRAEFGCEVAMGARTRSARATLRLSHGQRIALGALEVEALETPGHSPDGICYRAEGLLFTGTTLGIGSVGRADLPGASAEALWVSLNETLRPLPDGTIVLPGREDAGRLFSTIGVEKSRNEDWRLADRAAFVRRKQTETGSDADHAEARHFIAYNQEANPEHRAPESRFSRGAPNGRAGSDAAHIASINVEKYATKLQAHAPGHLFVDVREAAEFAEAWIPGTRNVALSDLIFHLEEWRGVSRIYFSCGSGLRSLMAAKTLDYLGFPDVVNVSGGLKAWEAASLRVGKKTPC